MVTGSDDKTVRVWSLEDGRLLQTQRVPIGEGDVGRVYAVAISPDGTTVAAGGWGPGANAPNSVYLFDRQTGRMKQHIDGLPNVILSLTFSPDGRHLVATLGGVNGMRVFDTADFSLVAEDTDYGSDSYGAAFDAAGRLVTASYDGQIRLYDADFALITSVEAPGGAQPFGVAFSPDSERIAVGYDDSTRVDVLDGETLAPRFEADTSGLDNGAFYGVTWSADGRFLYAGGQRDEIRRWADGGRGAYENFALSDNTIMDLRPLADGRLVFGAQDPAFGLLAADGSILWRRDPTKADFRDQLKALRVSPDGTKIAFGYGYGGETPGFFDLLSRRLTRDAEPDPEFVAASVAAPGLAIEDWKNTYTPTLNGSPLQLRQYERSRSLAIAPDGERFLLGTEWYLRCFDHAGDELWSNPGPGPAWAVNISGDGRLAVAAYGDGTIRWYRLEDGEELLAFYPDRGTAPEMTEDNLRWVAWTPQGYYMASPGGEDLIGWHINRGLDTPEFFSASRFRDRFNRPDIVELVLEELDVEKAVARADLEAEVAPALAPPLEDVLPPVIQILDPASGTAIEQDPLTIKYHVWTAGGEPVPTVRVMVNGVLALTWNEPEPAVPPEGRSGELFLPVIPRARDGKAIIRLIAENAHGASDPASVGLQIAATVAAETAPSKPRLFVLAVGVSRYREDTPLDLNYAAKDAEDLVNALLRQRGGLYEDVYYQVLLDDGACATDILRGLRWLREQTTAGDVVVVMLSGHGVVESNVYHFLPHDAVVTPADELALTAINEDRLMRSLTALYKKEIKVIAFFDTCHSGAFGHEARALPPDIDQMAAALASEENGVIVFTAGTGREIAKEDPSWENGALTEALLEALLGAAQRDEPYLRVSDLQYYLTKRVKALTDGAQKPQMYVPFKELSDLPIAVVN